MACIIAALSQLASWSPVALSEDLPASCEQGTDRPAHQGIDEERLATQLCEVQSGKELEALNRSLGEALEALRKHPNCAGVLLLPQQCDIIIRHSLSCLPNPL